MPRLECRYALMHAFGETVKLGRFIIRFSNIDAAIAKASTSKSSALVLFFPTLFALFALFDTEKNKKRYSTPTTPLRTRTILRSLDKRSILSLGASSVVVPFLRGRFSLLSSRASRWFVVLLLFISLSKGRNFFILMIIPEPRARAMMPRAARPSSNAKHSRRRPQRRDIALFRRLALTPKAFLKTEDKRARLFEK